MSDYEDEMDVDLDGPSSKSAVQFNSDNTGSKGKRVVADLPVEAEDNLPWSVISSTRCVTLSYFTRVEKYRPNTLNDVSGHQDIRATINRFVEHNVRSLPRHSKTTLLTISAPSPSPSLWPSWHWQDIDHPGLGPSNLWS